MYHVPLAPQCIYGRSDEGDEIRDGEEGKKRRLPGLLYADKLVLCAKPEEDLRRWWDVLLRCVGEDVWKQCR